jgi:hypothetical protein
VAESPPFYCPTEGEEITSFAKKIRFFDKLRSGSSDIVFDIPGPGVHTLHRGNFITGLRLDSNRIILEGAIPAALLALAVQGLFELAERFLVPRGLRLRPE